MEISRSEIHMHSSFSDGEYSPTELVKIAHQNEVGILALTDHDTFSGLEEFVEASQKMNIIAIPGIEITVRYRDFNLHLLGYFKSLESIRPQLWDRVEKMKKDREERMQSLVDKINEVVPDRFRGSITLENIKKGAEGVLGRPHLAREMVRLGIVRTSNEAFDKFLVKYNIEKENLHVKEAIELIRESNGIPILAHPGERSYSLVCPEKGRKWSGIPELLEELISYGLMGLECHYPYHEKTGKVQYFLDLADEYELIATGSRDFHGSVTHQKSDLLGTTPMEPSFWEQFQRYWKVS